MSSGAIALGRRELKLAPGALKLEESQAAAAVGQIALAHIYKELFAALRRHGRPDSVNARRQRASGAAISMRAPRCRELLELGALPVINENDTVATTEIRYGDNDRLAARVAQMTSADCLLLLSDVCGPVHRRSEPRSRPRGSSPKSATSRPRSKPWAVARHRPWVRAAWPPRSPRRRSRPPPAAPWPLPPARRCTRSAGSKRAPTAAGSCPRPTRRTRASNGSPGRCARAVRSRSMPARCRRCARARACCQPASTAVSGRFERGDTVSVLDRDGAEIARGMIAYNDRDAARIIGKRSADIEALLGFRGRAEMIHRDDLVLMRCRSRDPPDEPPGNPMNAAAMIADCQIRRRTSPAVMDRLGRDAVAAAAVLALASTAHEEPGAGEDRRRAARPRRRSC